MINFPRRVQTVVPPTHEEHGDGLHRRDEHDETKQVQRARSYLDGFDAGDKHHNDQYDDTLDKHGYEIYGSDGRDG